ncbi:MAG: hypothetical protein WCT22_00425 [Patescibacteria group bacterium]|jgi:hypothetical protein
MVNKNKIEWGLLFALLTLLVLFVVVIFSIKQFPVPIEKGPSSIESDKRAPTNIPIPTRVPRPIPHGKTEFTVSTGKGSPGPLMSQGSINPYDPKLGGIQTLEIEVAEPVSKVVAVLMTDHKNSPKYPLKKIKGTTWQGSWKVNDSYLYRYVLTIEATGPTGTSKIDITLR